MLPLTLSVALAHLPIWLDVPDVVVYPRQMILFSISAGIWERVLAGAGLFAMLAFSPACELQTFTGNPDSGDDACDGRDDHENPDSGDRACDDGDPCTTGDVVIDGVCGGEPIVCASPPLPVCLNQEIVRIYQTTGHCESGLCNYPFSDNVCPAPGCAGGECLPRCQSGTWRHEVVDTYGEAGHYTSLAVDDMGGVHVSYISIAIPYVVDEVRYAYRSPAGGWRIEFVDKNDFPRETALALGMSGEVHIMFSDQWGRLKHARRAGDIWTVETLELPFAVEDGNTIIMEPGGRLSASFVDLSTHHIFYGFWEEGAGWTTSVVDEDVAALYPSLVVDRFGNIVIAYLDMHLNDHKVKLAQSATGLSWETETVVHRSGLDGPCLGIDSSRKMHLAYSYSMDSCLGYAVREYGEEEWTVEVLDQNVGPYRDTGC